MVQRMYISSGVLKIRARNLKKVGDKDWKVSWMMIVRCALGVELLVSS